MPPDRTVAGDTTGTDPEAPRGGGIETERTPAMRTATSTRTLMLLVLSSVSAFSLLGAVNTPAASADDSGPWETVDSGPWESVDSGPWE